MNKLVKFGAGWCQPCRAMERVMEQVKPDYEGQLEIESVDIDDSPELTLQYGITKIPTFLFFKDGEVVESVRQPMVKKELKDKIKEVFGV